jgi:hypothetical protein
MGEQRTTNIAVNVEQHEDVQYERLTNAAIDVEYQNDTNNIRITNAAIMVEYYQSNLRLTNAAIMVEYNLPQTIVLDSGIIVLSGPQLDLLIGSAAGGGFKQPPFGIGIKSGF